MFTFQQATRDDADQIARIAVNASGGVAEQLLDGLIPGMSCVDILTASFIKGEGPYDTKNILRTLDEDRIVALLFSYPAEEHTVPPLLNSLIPARRLEPVRPFLERAVPESLYINTVWLDEPRWKKGYADALMVEAESRCRSLDRDRMSLFCWNDDVRAMQFFAAQGFAIVEHIKQEELPLHGHDKGASILCKRIGR